MTFQQTKKPTGLVSVNKIEYPFKFYENIYKKRSLDSKFKNKKTAEKKSRPINHERSEDCVKRKEQTRNNKANLHYHQATTRERRKWTRI